MNILKAINEIADAFKNNDIKAYVPILIYIEPHLWEYSLIELKDLIEEPYAAYINPIMATKDDFMIKKFGIIIIILTDHGKSKK